MIQPMNRESPLPRHDFPFVPPHSPDRRGLAIDLALLIAWPLMLLAITREWLFTPPGEIDAWVYFGTSANLTHNLVTFAGTYYVGRLSWILPGALAYAALPPVVANIGLHLAVFYGATLGCYTCLRLTVGRRAALVTALLLGAYPPFVHAVGWDYVDGVGLAYFLLAVGSGTAAARGIRPSWWSVVSGICVGACLISSLAWATVLPAYVLCLITVSPRMPVRTYSRRTLEVVVGATLSILACALVNARITGDPWFFLPSFTMARRLTSDLKPQLPTYSWIWERASLGTAVALFLVSVSRVLRWRAGDGTRERVAWHLAWAWSATAMLPFRINGTPVLQFTPYGSYLIPGMALATGALIASPLQQLSGRMFSVIVAVGLGAWSVVFATGTTFDAVPTQFAFVLSLAGVMLAAFFLRGASVRPLAAAIAFACISLVFLLHIERVSAEPGGRERNFHLTVDALAQLTPIQAQGKRMYFWYADDAPPALSTAYLSVSSCYLWGYSLFSTKFPSRVTPEGTVNTAQPRQRIVLLSEHPQALADVEASLGAAITVVHESRVARDAVSFSMLVFDVR